MNNFFMDNFFENLNVLLEYYFYSGKWFERLVLPGIIVISVLVLLRLFISWCFQIGNRVKVIKKLGESFGELEKTVKAGNSLTEENSQRLDKIKADLALLHEDMVQITKLIEKNREAQEQKSESQTAPETKKEQEQTGSSKADEHNNDVLDNGSLK